MDKYLRPLQSDLSIIKVFFFSHYGENSKNEKKNAEINKFAGATSKEICSYLRPIVIIKHMEAVFMFQTMCHEALCIHMGESCPSHPD